MSDHLVKRAKEIIEQIIYITIATSSKENIPWNSPVYSAYDEDYNFYWASWKENIHSKNIAENNQVFIVIYDSTAPEGTGEGVYIQAKAYMVEEDEEIKKALNYLSKRTNQKPAEGEEKKLTDQFPRRIYKAVPEKFWVNGEGFIKGSYIDTRTEINLLEDKKI
ncbi:pyridoxamine 5'-phosphate oxidase family protein [Candidatus Daviesbacteria bacterium]|nr:pyridoxamine 5'-phosphate oxidase family protein [Candidatus Daviesbacteria bacterium]